MVSANIASTDDALWQLVRAGDAEAFGVLFERYGKAIYNYCFRRTADWAAAEDLSSMVFLEVWRRREQDLAPGTVLAWLYGVATNLLRNRRRSSRRYAAALARIALPEPTPDFAGDVVERLDDEKQMARVLSSIATLTRRQQEVLALCDWSGLSYEAAAAALALPIGTVKSSLFRARKRIRELSIAYGHEHAQNVANEGASRSA
jgi:RNA polymerase sigma-70 factor (ECF subfamily)